MTEGLTFDLEEYFKLTFDLYFDRGRRSEYTTYVSATPWPRRNGVLKSLLTTLTGQYPACGSAFSAVLPRSVRMRGARPVSGVEFSNPDPSSQNEAVPE